MRYLGVKNERGTYMSSLLEYFKMAIKSIVANKGRSFLTMLGIIIGIASVIAIMSVGAGTTESMTAEANDVGGGQIYVSCSEDAVNANQMITAADMEAITSKVKGVEGVTPASGSSGTTVTGKGEFQLSLSAGTQMLQRMSNFTMKRGKYFTDADVQEGKNVCVLTDTDAKRLFGSDDVVGMDIDVTMDGMTYAYRIVGITGAKENTAFVSYSYEGQPVTLDIPYTSLTNYGYDPEPFYSIYVFADKTMDAKQITNSVIHILESRHQSAGEDFYRVQNFQDVLQSINSMMGMVTAFISFVAAISLLVGGIGVMNIMLVSVTERTREIGIRKSLGAKTSSIMVQFLAESAIITALGGVIGIILGVIAAFGICSIMTVSLGSTISPGISAGTILGATFFACAVGIFFGIYPARKAAKLSPIEALRRN